MLPSRNEYNKLNNKFHQNIIKAKLNDEQAIKNIFDICEPLIQTLIKYYKNIYNYIAIEDEDIRQECYIGILRTIPIFNENKSVGDFKRLARSYINPYILMYIQSITCVTFPQFYFEQNKIDEIKKYSIEPINKYKEILIDETDFVKELNNKQLISKIKSFMPIKLYNMLYLFYVEGYTLEEIGNYYCTSKQNVYNKLLIAKRRVISYFNKYVYKHEENDYVDI